MKTRFIALVLSLTMMLTLVSCSKATTEADTASEGTTEETSTIEATSDGAEKDTLVIGTSADPTDFSPCGTFNGMAMWVVKNIYEHLYDIDADGNYTYLAAESAVQEDATHILIKLRQGVKDTLGNELTASDLLYDIKYAQSTMFASMYAAINVENSETIDEYTVRLAMDYNYPIQMDILMNLDLFDEDSFIASGEDGMKMNPVGYGPYYMESYSSGVETVLKAREDYWGGEPEIKTVSYKVITEGSQRTNAIINGDVDMIVDVSISDAEYLKTTEGLTLTSDPSATSYGFFYNCSEVSPCNNIHLRKAIAYAIDTATLNSVGFKGMYSESEAFVSVGCSDYSSDWDAIAEKYDNYYEYNLEKAKEELELAGYPDGLTLEAIHYTTCGGDTNSSMIQYMLSEIGITLNVTTLDGGSFNARLSDEPEIWDIAFSGWTAGAPYSSEIISIQLLQSNFSLWNGYEGYAECETATNAARSADSKEEMISLSTDAIEVITEYLPALSLQDVASVYCLNEGLDFQQYSTGLTPIWLFKMSWN